MKVRGLILLFPLLAALSCGPRKTAATQPVTREFPMADIPMMMTETSERVVWLSAHFWDRFTDTDSLYYSDSVTVNGVTIDDLERQMGIFTTLTEQIPLQEGVRSMNLFFQRLEAFQRAYPQANLLPQTVALATRYFYDPNSPVRSEDLYLPFVTQLSHSDLIDPAYRKGYEWDARMCALNRVGTPASDFAFVDTQGRTRKLYDIRAEYLLLIFGHPDCHACKELTEEMEAYPEITEFIDSGRLKVADIYIDQDIDAWKAQIPAYPKAWINGYDPAFVIRTDLLYNVRALPSIYLLDKDKTVLLKDATPANVLDFLLNL